MLASRHIRALSAPLLVAALSYDAPAQPPRPTDFRADSLFDAGAYDSLLSFAARGLETARGQGDSVQAGRMLYYRGRARLALQKPGAREDIDRALEVSAAVEDSLGRANALGLKAFIVLNEGRLDESIRLNEERLAIATAARHLRSAGWGHLLIAYATMAKHDLARAEREYREAARVFEAAGRPREALTALIGLGLVHAAAGRPEEARAAHRRALESARRLGDRNQEADCWNNLGSLELEGGDLAVAADHYRRAYDLKRALGAADIVQAATNLAGAHTLIGRYAAAESALVGAIPLARAWHFELALGAVYNDLGRLRLLQERPRGAAVYFRKTLARGDSTAVADRLSAVAGLADALAAQDSLEAALSLMDAHAVRVFAMPPSMWRSEVLVTWSRCLRAAGEPARALTAARGAHDDAAARSDTTGLVLAALERSAVHRALGDPAGAFEWFDHARARFGAGSRRTRDYEWREAYRAGLAPQLVAGAVVLLEWPRDRAAADRERALFDFVQEIRARTLMERITDPRHGDRGADVAAMVTAERLQRELREGECLLDISAGRERVFVFAVTRDSLRLSVVEDADGALERRARRYNEVVASPARHDVAPAAAPGELLAGVADIVRSAASLVIVADGWVASLPFAAFPVDGEPLVDRVIVSMIPAASLLLDLRALTSPAPRGGILALAPAGPGLPGAEREVRRLASRYNDVQAVDSALAIDAVAEAARARGVIHVASHVHVYGERPWHSGIQMGADSASAAYLRASDIARANLAGRLAVLSSCESALGRATQGEGVLGVTTAFLAAGARTVVASLWKVDDRTTTDLMLAFYHGLEQGLAAGEALRAAQLALRRDYPAPFHWAGFVVVGDADATVALARRPSSRIPMVLLSFAGVVAVAAVIVSLRRRTASTA